MTSLLPDEFMAPAGTDFMATDQYQDSGFDDYSAGYYNHAPYDEWYVPYILLYKVALSDI